MNDAMQDATALETAMGLPPGRSADWPDTEAQANGQGRAGDSTFDTRALSASLALELEPRQLAQATIRDLKRCVRAEASHARRGKRGRLISGFYVLYLCSSICHFRFAAKSRYPDYQYLLIYHFYAIFVEKVVSRIGVEPEHPCATTWDAYLWLNRRLFTTGCLGPATGAVIGAYAHIRCDLAEGIERALDHLQYLRKVPVHECEIARHLFDRDMRRVFVATFRHFLRFPTRVGNAGCGSAVLRRSRSWAMRLAEQGVLVVHGWRRAAWRSFAAQRDRLAGSRQPERANSVAAPACRRLPVRAELSSIHASWRRASPG